MSEPTWFQILLLPSFENGMSQTMRCLVCGAAVVVTTADQQGAVDHINWHERVPS